MKKILSSVLAILTAGLTFVFLSIPCLTHSIGSKQMSSWTGWEILDYFTSDFKCFTLYQIFVIATMVLAGLAFIVAIIILLQQIKIVKAKANFGIILAALLCLYTITALVSMIAIIGLANSITLSNITYKVGIGLIFPWIVGLIATGTVYVLTQSKK